MKYIDADKLIAEIEGRLIKYDPDYTSAGSELKGLLSFVASIKQEQPEVVLTDNASFTKELKRFLSNLEDEKKSRELILSIIKHFYELGRLSNK